MAKTRNVFVCRFCGYESAKWSGKCPTCKSFNAFDEVSQEIVKLSASHASGKFTKPTTLDEIQEADENRLPTKMKELDRVLSGGIVEGSLTLIGGDPGIGKSTILLQICQNIGLQGKNILYISGEESTRQIKMRADRLQVNTTHLYVLSETNMGYIEQVIKNSKPDLVIVDSIQTVSLDEITSVAGSISQVRECTSMLMKLAKSLNISIILVSHVTKDGNIAGPKILEHIVDTVLYFEGESKASYRIIRSVKNRFGSTNEIGVFEMGDVGLKEIENPSEYMLSGRPLNVSGTAVTSSMEGTRPLLTEVQALVSYTNFGNPRRMSTGTDYNRVVMLMAVLEKHVGMQFSSFDSYINIAGGLKINEPAIDLAVVAAIASSFRNVVIDPYTLFFGEVGLTGEIRAVTMAEQRIMEAHKLGFQQCVIPMANKKGLKIPGDMRIFGASNINELIDFLG